MCSLNSPLSTAGKKSWPSKGSNAKESTQNGQEADDEEHAVVDASFEQTMVAVTQALEMMSQTSLHANERIGEAWTGAFRRSSSVRASSKYRAMVGTSVRESRYEASIAKHNRFRERNEQIARHAGKKKHGHEHDANGQRGNQGGHSDLRSAVQNGLHDFLALINVAIDVLNFHGGVVHQDSDGQGESAERHDVDGFAQRAEHDQRGEDGERNRDGNDQRAAPASQEDQNHEAGEASGDDRFANHADDGSFHEDGLIGKRIDDQCGRQGSL